VVVLLTGATGFIGGALADALAVAGHDVVAVARQPQPGRWCPGDFTRDHAPEDWAPRLRGVDAVVNAVGILREQGAQTFEALHVRAPRALFAACAIAGIDRVVQISALGADGEARSRYHLSKRAADEFLLETVPRAVVAQPALVFGPGGASAALFGQLAALPVVPLPQRGAMLVQPVHIDDLVAALVALVAGESFRGTRVPLAGPQALPLARFVATLRQALDRRPAPVLDVPLPLARAAARAAGALPGALLDRETLDMLLRGNTGDPAPLRELCGRPPRAPAEFVRAHEAPALRRAAALGLALPVLRLSVAALWIVTALLSFGLYPKADSLALLARVGLAGVLAEVALYGAAALDLALGLATLLRPGRRLWLAQVVLILGYTAIISIFLPEFWLHPFGPVLKNVPLLAALWLLLQLEERP
jgi:uncharacterized protein YbjT (DUF2867 family)